MQVNPGIFKAYDIRGIYPAELDEQAAYLIGRAFVNFIERNVSHSIACQHCEDAPCIEACMSNCISRDEKTGKVDMDRSRCVACWMCVMACPFGIISREIDGKNKAVKCDLCPDRECPACVDACPTKTLSHETRDEFLKRVKDTVKVYGKI